MHMICGYKFFVDGNEEVAFLSEEDSTMSSLYAGERQRIFRPSLAGDGSERRCEDEIIDFLSAFLSGS